MNYRRSIALLTCGLLLFALSACNDDPSGVGLGVGPRGFDGGTPVRVELAPTRLASESTADVTGNSVRILTGRVDDPVVGVTETLGYLDVSPPSTLPDGFADGPVTDAQLVLRPRGATANLTVSSYVYGDTLSPMVLEVFEMPTEWEATTSDETLTAAPTPVATSAPFTPGDTVRIDLPSTWSRFGSLNDTTGFDDAFHGFELRASAGNAVVGFVRPSSALEVVVGEDTVAYDATKSFTSVTRPASPDFQDRFLIQDGSGQALSFSFQLPDSLQDAPISRAELRLTADTTLFDPATRPNGFVRPRPGNLVLQGFVPDADNTVALAVSDSLGPNGRFLFSSNPEISLRQVFQQAAFGQATIEDYRLTLSQANNTIDPLLFYGLGTGLNAPRVVLTVTEADR